MMRSTGEDNHRIHELRKAPDEMLQLTVINRFQPAGMPARYPKLLNYENP